MRISNPGPLDEQDMVERMGVEPTPLCLQGSAPARRPSRVEHALMLGAEDGNRTRDPDLASRCVTTTLHPHCWKRLEGWEGVEPSSPCRSLVFGTRSVATSEVPPQDSQASDRARSRSYRALAQRGSGHAVLIYVRLGAAFYLGRPSVDTLGPL